MASPITLTCWTCGALWIAVSPDPGAAVQDTAWEPAWLPTGACAECSEAT